MLTFEGGYEAWVEVDGVRLGEYALGEFLNPRRVPVLVSWIACATGKVCLFACLPDLLSLMEARRTI